MSGPMEAAFYVAAVVAVVSTLLAITRLVAVHALLYLIVSFLAVAVVFYTMGAPLVATLEVIIYAGATILGGETVIGKGALIGGNVFITTSVPPMNRVTAEPPKLMYRERGKRKQKGDLLDFQI